VARSAPDEDFEGFTGVHGPVAVGHGVETDLAVEHLAGLDAAVENAGQQRVDLGAGRCGAAGEGDVGPKRLPNPTGASSYWGTPTRLITPPGRTTPIACW